MLGKIYISIWDYATTEWRLKWFKNVLLWDVKCSKVTKPTEMVIERDKKKKELDCRIPFWHYLQTNSVFCIFCGFFSGELWRTPVRCWWFWALIPGMFMKKISRGPSWNSRQNFTRYCYQITSLFYPQSEFLIFVKRSCLVRFQMRRARNYFCNFFFFNCSGIFEDY